MMPEDARDLTYPGGQVRLYLDAPLKPGAEVSADEGQTHYLLHVMRAKAGDRVRLFNGRDGEFLAVVAKSAKRAVTLACEKQIHAQSVEPDVWLLFAPIKRAPIDSLVEKAAELGVARLLPVITRRTIAARVNLDRLRAHAVEAAEQSDRLSVPEIDAPRALDAALKDWDPARRLIFCDEGGDAHPLADAAREAPAPAAILIGPEGGFDPAERAMLRTQSFVIPASLGPRILRADTAALAALTIWQSVSGDWRKP